MTWNSSIQKMTSLIFDSAKLAKIIIHENITWILSFRNMTSAFSNFRKSVKFTTNSLQMTSNSSFQNMNSPFFDFAKSDKVTTLIT